ncbi:PAS domain-containing protein [Tistlia consotensis]|uniref:PAS domain-containing protein n=1 Tax=Tistlia consotensis USBA 355 TaxID=560819 RepID=A0A1Y6C655_9PROT|nr:PAS domain-containing protein [Tistlia consotensis]SMF38367.1 PAS domain-containing protein [Tistlia consotensis USBA 355]SNR37211.1 PAS domain-containing protein [Tistlia consotensis]
MAIDLETGSSRPRRVYPGRAVAARAAALPRPEGAVLFRCSEPQETLLRVFDYWRARRGGRRWPRRADIDPVDIPELLPEIILLDVVGDPPRFRKRLVGSAIVQKEGSDTTGRWLDETVNPTIRDEVLRQHREATEQPEGCCYTVEFAGADGKLYSYQRLLLPLSSDGERVDMLFGGARFLPAIKTDPRFR